MSQSVKVIIPNNNKYEDSPLIYNLRREFYISYSHINAERLPATTVRRLDQRRKHTERVWRVAYPTDYRGISLEVAFVYPLLRTLLYYSQASYTRKLIYCYEWFQEGKAY